MGKHLRRSAVWTIALVALFASAGVARQIVVSSVADSGMGTLRWALGVAQSGDMITFDGQVFPARTPATIYLQSELPPLGQGGVTLDGSDAGVIIDGSRTPEDVFSGISIFSDRNVVRGLQIFHFKGSGIAICSGSSNTIGGTRSVGKGPLGQGNLVCDNGIGVDLCDRGTGNIITGNLVGVLADEKTPSGNTCRGIWVENGVTNTQIGPGNIVAYNGCAGIEISGSQAVNNTVIQNMIYENAGGSLQVWQGASCTYSGLLAPTFTAVDMTSGLVQGTACGRCRVEVFSSGEGGCDIYEGTAEADSAGAFALRLDAPLRGPNIAAVATDPSGSFSPAAFFAPLGRRVVLQSGNALPQARLMAKPSWELEDNRIGAHWHLLWEGAPDGLERADIEGFPFFAACLGMKRFRLSINSMDSSSVHWDKQELQIDRLHDRFIDSLVSNGIAVTMVLSFWDTAHRAAGWPPIPRFTSETDIQRYLEYVRFMVGHFRGRVECYELWNEPTIEGTIQWVRLPDYLNLVRRAVPVIQEIDPMARVVVGGTDYLRYEHSWEFMLGLVSSDVMALVDVVSFHPLYGTTPEFTDDREYYYDYPRLAQSLIGEARAHGFQGEFRADELVWRTPETTFPGWPNPVLSTERRAAKYYARSIIANLGLGIAVSQLGVEAWSGRGDSFEVVQNLATIMAGHSAIDIPAVVDIQGVTVAQYGFRFPNGDLLFAVWNDGIPTDGDQGRQCTIRFPSLSAERIVGTDVLNGFEQELVFEQAGSGIEVRDLSLKDYPILIGIIGGP
jgi:hypothetical protein